MHATVLTQNNTRAVKRAGDPAGAVQDRLAQIRHLSYAAIREITSATQHAEQSVECLPPDTDDLASARDALEQAVTLLADACAWLTMLTDQEVRP